MRKSNYDKFPATRIAGSIWTGWDSIRQRLSLSDCHFIAIDTYTGVYENEISDGLRKAFTNVVFTRDLMKSEDEIRKMTAYFMTDDVLFGHMAPYSITDFFMPDAALPPQNGGRTLVIGPGAALFAPEDDSLLVYADMARWEIQQRFRSHSVPALGIDNRSDAVSVQYKRGYFIDWNVCDRHKETLFNRAAFWLDTNSPGNPKMTDADTFMRGIEQTVKRPFRVVPFFDPAPWGGQWMKEVCDLDRTKDNYGWCFDCVPEENSLLFDIDGVLFELPSIDAVLLKSTELLGEAVEGRYGKEFPIRFDFLDTMGGGNLSLQVHPTTGFVHSNFGIHYTQDESYYILDAKQGAHVYLGLKTGTVPSEMIDDLRQAQDNGKVFDAEKYVNVIPAKKHDHFLIPAGTVHCSGAGCMVLEISATPSIFTFKLWDWQRLGLDGKPRPINIERGSKVINWSRDTECILKNHCSLINGTASGDGWREERTGLHPAEPIETTRTRFSKTAPHFTGGSVNVLNLAEGEQATVSSPSGAFEPFTVHYAETFIVPAHIGSYLITPSGPSEGKECVTIKASVRH